MAENQTECVVLGGLVGGVLGCIAFLLGLSGCLAGLAYGGGDVVTGWLMLFGIGGLLIGAVIGAVGATGLPKRRVRIENEDGSEVHTVRGWTALVRLLDPDDTQFIKEIIRDTHSSQSAICRDAVEALGYLNSAQALCCLAEVLTQDESVGLRVAAAESLDRHGSRAARRVLQRVLDSDPPEAVRDACWLALG